MKIKALKSFGLDGRTLQPGEEAVVRKEAFGDNLQSFVDGGLLEVVGDAPATPEPKPAEPSVPDPQLPAAQKPTETPGDADHVQTQG